MPSQSIPILPVAAVTVTVATLAVLLYWMVRMLRLDTDERLKGEIELLVNSLGRVTPPIDPTQLKKLHDQADFPRMLGWIKNSMRLDLRVGIRIVDSGPDRTPMWIETPRAMAPFGTEEFRRTRVIVNVRKDVLDRYPFEWIVAGFAHELAHVVLFATGHPLQHSERAVDLAAMIAGYRNFVIKTDNTKIHGGVFAVTFAMLALPLGLLFIPGHTKSSLGYLTRGEKRTARSILEKIEKANRTTN